MTVTFEVEQGKTSGCSPIVFISPQPYAKVTFKSHKIPSFTVFKLILLFDSSTYRNSDYCGSVLFQKRPQPGLYSKGFKNSF